MMKWRHSTPSRGWLRWKKGQSQARHAAFCICWGCRSAQRLELWQLKSCSEICFSVRSSTAVDGNSRELSCAVSSAQSWRRRRRRRRRRARRRRSRQICNFFLSSKTWPASDDPVISPTRRQDCGQVCFASVSQSGPWALRTLFFHRQRFASRRRRSRRRRSRRRRTLPAEVVRTLEPGLVSSGFRSQSAHGFRQVGSLRLGSSADKTDAWNCSPNPCSHADPACGAGVSILPFGQKTLGMPGLVCRFAFEGDRSGLLLWYSSRQVKSRDFCSAQMSILFHACLGYGDV